MRFQTKGGKILNRGKLNDQGSITCYCKQCNGEAGGVLVGPLTRRVSCIAGPLRPKLWFHVVPPLPAMHSSHHLAHPAGKPVSASEFEEHSGSKDRRPADGIYLESESCWRASYRCAGWPRVMQAAGWHLLLGGCLLWGCLLSRLLASAHPAAESPPPLAPASFCPAGNNRSLKELLNLINSAEMAAAAAVVDVHMEECYHCKVRYPPAVVVLCLVAVVEHCWRRARG